MSTGGGCGWEGGGGCGGGGGGGSGWGGGGAQSKYLAAPSTDLLGF